MTYVFDNVLKIFPSILHAWYLSSYVFNHSWKYKLNFHILLLKTKSSFESKAAYFFHYIIRNYIGLRTFLLNICVRSIMKQNRNDFDTSKNSTMSFSCFEQFYFILISSSSRLSIAICNIFCAIRVGAKSCILQNSEWFF